MGIAGLLPFLAPVTRPVHLQDLRGRRVAVDAYVWLHRGAAACPADLLLLPSQPLPASTTSASGPGAADRHTRGAFGSGHSRSYDDDGDDGDDDETLNADSQPLGQLPQPPDLKKPPGYVTFCLRRIELLQRNGVIPVLVFDGGCLPMKRPTERGRRRRRAELRERARAAQASGDAARAAELLQQSVDVTPRMAHELIARLRALQVEFVVAPYEADAQLAALERAGRVDAVLTEDSDLVVFGCRRVLVKLDGSGNAMEVDLNDLRGVPELRRGGWTLERLRQACILAGCDYVPSLKGIGLKKAVAALTKHGSIEQTLRYWQTWGKLAKAPVIRKGYEHEVRMAEKTFLYQRVYDTERRQLVTLNPLPEGETVDPRCIGPDLSPEVACGIAEGRLNPLSKKPYGFGDDDNDAWDFFSDAEENSGNNDIFSMCLSQESPAVPVAAAPEDFNFWGSTRASGGGGTVAPAAGTEAAASSPVRLAPARPPLRRVQTASRSHFFGGEVATSDAGCGGQQLAAAAALEENEAASECIEATPPPDRDENYPGGLILDDDAEGDGVDDHEARPPPAVRQRSEAALANMRLQWGFEDLAEVRASKVNMIAAKPATVVAVVARTRSTVSVGRPARAASAAAAAAAAAYSTPQRSWETEDGEDPVAPPRGSSSSTATARAGVAGRAIGAALAAGTRPAACIGGGGTSASAALATLSQRFGADADLFGGGSSSSGGTTMARLVVARRAAVAVGGGNVGSGLKRRRR